jgi:acyl-coenzyme A thioesterase PaaI-like protein
VTASSAHKRSFWDVPEAPLDPAWREKRRLASALRELCGLCVGSEADAETLAHAADTVDQIRERLAAYPRSSFQDGYLNCKTPEEFARFADRSTMTGASNPIAPPMHLTMEGETAVANVTFGPPYEGIPGHVHGGLVAAAFDQLFGYLQTKQNVGSLTAALTVHYRAPTPLLEPLRMEARLLGTEGRKSTVSAKMLHRDVVTAEADGIFVAIDPTRMRVVIAKRNEG